MFEKKSLREAFGEKIVELGKINEKIVVFSADLEDSTRAEYFKKTFPDRFFNMGIAEQDMVGTAAGFAKMGFCPFVTSFAVFLTNQAYGIIRMICYNKVPIKFVATHAGLTVGEDGASAQCLEDIAIMRVLPEMKVFVPVDYYETKKIIEKVVFVDSPVYVRLTRAEFPVLTDESSPFEIGKGNILVDGEDVTIVAIGIMVSRAIEAAKILEKENISCKVINMSSIKPIDEELIIDSAKKTKCIVTAEEHQINGGLGSAVAEVLSRNYPVPVEFVAVNDRFGESGEAFELLDNYGLSINDIINAVKNVLKRKGR